MKWIHIIAGLLALVAGAIALYSPKGGTAHRKVGMSRRLRAPDVQQRQPTLFGEAS